MNNEKMYKKILKNPFIKEILSIIQILLVSLIILIPIKFFIVEPFLVDGESMSPNYETYDYLIVNKTTGFFGNINRGETVILVPPHQRSDSFLKYTSYLDDRKKYIKRIIALPRERIVLKDGEIFIQKENSEKLQKLKEPYLKNNGTIREIDIKLSENEYFVLGDNRSNSLDSEEFGPIKRSDILGKPLFRLFPFTKINYKPALYSEYKIDN